MAECVQCQKYFTCDVPCVYVEEQLDPVGSKDKIVKYDDGIYTESYNNQISEGLEQKQRHEITLEAIKGIGDRRLRVVASLIYCGFRVIEIAEIVRLSESQVYRIVKRGVKNAA